VSAWAAIPLHVKKLAVMVNGTTYAKKIEVEHKKRKQKYRYKNKIGTINIPNTRYIEYIVLLINE